MKNFIPHVVIFIAFLTSGAWAFAQGTAQSSSPSSTSAARFKTKSGVEIMVDARTLSRDLDRQVIELKDDVRVIYGDKSFRADSATIFLATEEVEARGNISVESVGSRIEAEWIKINYKNNTGELHNAVIRSGQVTLEGQRIQQIGDDEYVAEKAYFTACDTCPPAWSFRGQKVQAKLGGYAHIKNAWFEIGHIPILPIPYMIFPLKSERQTGLLIPSIGYESGTTITDEFFWAINKSQDATFQLKNYQSRGLQGGVSYRYMLSERSEGELNTSGLQDKRFPGDPIFLAKSPNGKATYNRWFVSYDHFYELPDNFTQYARLNLISDLYYPRDFEKQLLMARNNRIPINGEPAVESRVYLARRTENTFSGIDSSYYVNLMKDNPVADNSDAVHRFPELRYSITQTKVADSNLLFKLDINYVNFARQDFGYDDVIEDPQSASLPANDPCKYPDDTSTPDDNVNAGICDARSGGSGRGTYEPELDVIRAGQRLQFTPEFTYPMQVGRLFDLTPRLSYQHSRYAFNVSPNSRSQAPAYSGAQVDEDPSRDIVRSSLSLRTRMSHIFGTQRPEKETRYRHEIEPELIVSGVPYFRQSQSRFLGKRARTPAFLESQPISNTDFTSQFPSTGGTTAGQGIQFDYNDRIYNRTLLTAVLTNKLVRKKWDADTSTYRQIVNFKLLQSYDFDQAKETVNRYPWSDIAALTAIRFDDFEVDSTVRYFPYHNKTNTSANLIWRDQRRNYLSLGVTQTFLISENLNEAYPKRDETIATGAGINLKYLHLAGQANWLPTDWKLVESRIKSWGATVMFVPPGNCWGIRTIFTQEIGGERKVEVNFDWNNLGF